MKEGGSKTIVRNKESYMDSVKRGKIYTRPTVVGREKEQMEKHNAGQKCGFKLMTCS